jgi:hypothetical protein
MLFTFASSHLNLFVSGLWRSNKFCHDFEVNEIIIINSLQLPLTDTGPPFSFIEFNHPYQSSPRIKSEIRQIVFFQFKTNYPFAKWPLC